MRSAISGDSAALPFNRDERVARRTPRISGHPHVLRRADDFDPSDPCRHFIQSPAFKQHFAKTSEAQLFPVVTNGMDSSSPKRHLGARLEVAVYQSTAGFVPSAIELAGGDLPG